MKICSRLCLQRGVSGGCKGLSGLWDAHQSEFGMLGLGQMCTEIVKKRTHDLCDNTAVTADKRACTELCCFDSQRGMQRCLLLMHTFLK